MQKDITIKTMRFENLNRVYEIERDVFLNPWPRAFFEHDLKSVKTIALVAEDTEKVIGYSIATCIDVELHITNIAVDKHYQRHGVATELMKNIEHIARERACRYAYLEVRTHNVAAIKLYENLGYSILYTRRHYYIDGDDAYVMQKELS